MSTTTIDIHLPACDLCGQRDGPFALGLGLNPTIVCGVCERCARPYWKQGRLIDKLRKIEERAYKAQERAQFGTDWERRNEAFWVANRALEAAEQVYRDMIADKLPERFRNRTEATA